MPPRRRSTAWKFFTVIADGKKAKCQLCGLMLVYSRNSTTNLRRHIITKHKPEAPQIFEEPAVITNSSGVPEKAPPIPYEGSPGFVKKKKKTSGIWKYFTSSPGTQGVECVLCGSNLSYVPSSTTNLWKHIVSQHPSVLPSMSTKMSFGNDDSATFNIHNEERKRILDEKVVKMIVKDLHPISVVESEGFIDLMSFSNPGYILPDKKSITNELLPNLYKQALDNVVKRLDGINHIALTTEMWSSQNHEHCLSVTAHFISPMEWTPQSVLLSTTAFRGTPSGKDLSAELQRIVTEWHISDRMTVMVTDNETNTLLANEQLPWAYIPCFGNLLHLVVNDAIASDKEVTALIEKVSDIVEFFKHSPLAKQSLNAAQKELNLPESKLLVYTPARWNSIYYMLERTYEQMEAVNAVLEANDMHGKCLLEQDSEIIKKTISTLKPFEVACISLLKDRSSSISMAMPIVKGLVKVMKSVTGVKEPLTQNLRDGLVASFGKMEEIEWVVTATLLDPRFKKYKFAEQTFIDKAKEIIISEVCQMVEPKQNITNSSNILASSTSDTFWDFLERVDNDDVDMAEKSVLTLPSSNREVNCYLESTPIPRNEDALFYWKQHMDVLPNLYKVAMKYMCVPITCIPSERLFTKVGDSFVQKMSRLKTQHTNMILFLNKNK